MAQRIVRGETASLQFALDYDTAGELTGQTVEVRLVQPGATEAALTLACEVTGTEDYTVLAEYTGTQSTSLTADIYEYHLWAVGGAAETWLGAGIVVVTS